MSRPLSATINLNALKHNLARVKQLSPQSKVMAVIKANAYGHGVLPVADALRAADAYAVSCCDEAVLLRQHGVTHPIIVLEGFFDKEELACCLQHELDVVVHTPSQVALMEAYEAEQRLANHVKSLNVWMKIDSGMHRLGFAPAEVATHYQRLAEFYWVNQPIHFMTHLACADDIQSPVSEQQHQCFMETVKPVSSKASQRSLANSAAIVAHPALHHDWVRPGIMLYGVNPLLSGCAQNVGLKPVMTLSAELISVKQLRKGDSVGYGQTWTCPQDMNVGVVSVGYGDGYPRHAPSGTPVVVNGIKTTLIGRVSMDMIVVDLRPVSNPQVGMPVELWGERLPIEEVAYHSGTIAYELLCNITQRVPRLYR